MLWRPNLPWVWLRSRPAQPIPSENMHRSSNSRQLRDVAIEFPVVTVTFILRWGPAQLVLMYRYSGHSIVPMPLPHPVGPERAQRRWAFKDMDDAVLGHTFDPDGLDEKSISPPCLSTCRADDMFPGLARIAQPITSDNMHPNPPAHCAVHPGGNRQ